MKIVLKTLVNAVDAVSFFCFGSAAFCVSYICTNGIRAAKKEREEPNGEICIVLGLNDCILLPIVSEYMCIGK